VGSKQNVSAYFLFSCWNARFFSEAFPNVRIENRAHQGFKGIVDIARSVYI
jgi:hypothetical protein